MYIVRPREEAYFCQSCNFKTSGIFDEKDNRCCPVCKAKLWHCSACGYRGSALKDNFCPNCQHELIKQNKNSLVLGGRQDVSRKTSGPFRH